MAYDEGLAQRVEESLDDMDLPEIVGKKMFGGIGYMVRGNMACGVHKDYLIVRVGRDQYQDALSAPHTTEFDITGRPMTGWVMIHPKGVEQDDALKKWVKMGARFALSLEAK